ncbi:MAG: leucine-rich repeat domain-containing protein, partial [Oscillospiraceae bacterium]
KYLISVKNLNCNIGDSAFYDCIQLSEIILGDGVKIIGKNAFHGCSLLCSVVFGKGIYSIEPSAFSFCYHLDNVNLEKTQISILSSECFRNCGIYHIIFPKTLKIIERLALYDNPLTGISIPDYVKEVNSNFINSDRIAFLGNDTVISGPYHCEFDGTIYCLPGSKAQEFCQKIGLNYLPLSEFPTE